MHKSITVHVNFADWKQWLSHLNYLKTIEVMQIYPGSLIGQQSHKQKGCSVKDKALSIFSCFSHDSGCNNIKIYLSF